MCSEAEYITFLLRRQWAYVSVVSGPWERSIGAAMSLGRRWVRAFDSLPELAVTLTAKMVQGRWLLRIVNRK